MVTWETLPQFFFHLQVKSLSHERDISNWKSAIDLLYDLMTVLKQDSSRVYSSRTYVVPVLKHSIVYVDSFVRHCIPLLDRCFKGRRDECLDLLKKMQANTRLLQMVCNHSKIQNDPCMSRHVPALKRSLETVLYRVKGMLQLNGATELFTMAVLKNKDLQGRELVEESFATTTTNTQDASDGEEEGEDEEEERDQDEEDLPEEDASELEEEEGDENSYNV